MPINYYSVVNFTAFTIKLWELVTDNWMIIYSKKIMKAVKPRLGQQIKISSSSPATLEVFILSGN